MSSTGTTNVATNAATNAAVTTTMGRQTYWCHECDMSVSLLLLTAPTPTPSLRCPYCQSDFLEEMDSPPPSNPSDPNPTNSPPLDPIHQHNTTTFHFPTDDNFLLDSPYLHRLIHHLTNTDPDGSSPSTTTITNATASRHHCPAAKSAVEAIPTIKITGGFLDLDPIVLCAVCKDQFVVDDETKQLPCKHMYHPDCILPWLSQHNSCPVCRFQLPIEEVKGGCCGGRRRRSRILRLGELMEDDEELFGFGSTLRHIARRHRLVFPVESRRENRERDEVLFSPSQIEEEGEVGLPGEPGRADSVETVSSGWPSWPVEAGVVIGSDNGDATMANEEVIR